MPATRSATLRTCPLDAQHGLGVGLEPGHEDEGALVGPRVGQGQGRARP